MCQGVRSFLRGLSLLTHVAPTLLLAGAASGQPQVDLQAWVHEQLEHGWEWLPSAPVKAAWKSTVFPLPEETVRKMRKDVAGHPDHPLIPRLAESDRRVKNGPDTIDYTLWFATESLWRTAVDQSDFEEKFNDQAIGDGASWVMNRRSMELHSARAAPRGPFEGEMGIGYVRDFVSQGFTHAFGRGATFELKTIRTNPDWLLEFSGPPGLGRIAGGWGADGSPEVHEITYLDPGGGPPRQRVVVSGVVFDAVLNSPRATRIEMHGPYSNVAVQWISATQISKDEVSIRAKPPDPAGSDPVRGPLTVTRVNDFRGDAGVFRVKENDDEWRTVTQQQVARDFAWLRRLGWALASLIVIVILGLRVRAARAA